MLMVGLTGSACSGKSTVLKFFRECGAKTLNSDQITRELVKLKRPAYVKIVRHFGEDVKGPGGRLDRKRLRMKVLENPRELRFLEKVLHPGVRREILKQKKKFGKKKGLFVVEVPLLFETGLHRMMDTNVCLTVPQRKHKRLVVKHHLKPGDVKKFSLRQWPQDKKAKFADHVVRNHQSLKALKGQVKLLYRQLR